MIVGFDFDGVLCDIEIPILNYMRTIEGKEAMRYEERKYYMSRKPLLNPVSFLHEEDEFIVVTARYSELEEISRKWLDIYCPNYKALYLVGSDSKGFYKDHAKWKLESAKKKIKILEDYGVEVYFDDNPSWVKIYRELTDIPVIQYGGRFEY